MTIDEKKKQARKSSEEDLFKECSRNKKIQFVVLPSFTSFYFTFIRNGFSIQSIDDIGSRSKEGQDRGERGNNLL